MKTLHLLPEDSIIRGLAEATNEAEEREGNIEIHLKSQGENYQRAYLATLEILLLPDSSYHKYDPEEDFEERLEAYDRFVDYIAESYIIQEDTNNISGTLDAGVDFARGKSRFTDVDFFDDDLTYERQAFRMTREIARRRVERFQAKSEQYANIQEEALVNLVLFAYTGDSYSIQSDFLYGLVTNDLERTVTHADLRSRKDIVELVYFILNHYPAGARGSKEAVKNWEGLDNIQHPFINATRAL